MSERRFRGSIYFDVWVPETGDLETDRAEARRIADEFAGTRPNSYVGGVGLVEENPGLRLLQPLDREI